MKLRYILIALLAWCTTVGALYATVPINTFIRVCAIVFGIGVLAAAIAMAVDFYLDWRTKHPRPAHKKYRWRKK